MSEQPFDAGDKAQVEKAKSKVQNKQARLEDGFRQVMGSANGRAFIWELLSICGLFRTSFNPSNAITAFNEGQRNIGLEIMAKVHRLKPEKYIPMVRENSEP